MIFGKQHGAMFAFLHHDILGSHFAKAIASGDQTAAKAVFQESQSVIDGIADKKIVHKNLASRTKSRLSAGIKAMAA